MKNLSKHDKDCFNISQLRIITWNHLKASTQKLVKSKEQSHLLKDEVIAVLENLAVVESYWSFPGKTTVKSLRQMFDRKEFTTLNNNVSDNIRILVSESYRDNESGKKNNQTNSKKEPINNLGGSENYFEVLIVDNLTSKEEEAVKDRFRAIRGSNEKLSYDLLAASTFQDALIAILFNYNIQACVIRYGVSFKSKNKLDFISPYISRVLEQNFEKETEADLGLILGNLIKTFRPELDIYYVTDTAVSQINDTSLSNFRRIFYRKEDIQELHLSIILGVQERFVTPFYSALRAYSQKPTSVFHAMPISRGNSVFKSNWIKDFGEFYGRNLFLAETSATTGGLDSLLQPTGPLKESQELASKAYGSEHTFFVTNGTSTSNKIVVQALIEPQELVLVDRDCHKSHHYGMVLAGAYPVYLDSYSLERYSMYGAVTTKTIVDKLLLLKKEGVLHKVKMLLLTNCTFDGLVYNVEQVMEAALTIKPDLVFLWDEAWFAFAGFTYTYKQRTAMFVASKLRKKYHSAEYKAEYDELKAKNDPKLATMPDPEKVKVRVYSTQSTHKTLSSFRQGSMIHIHDEEFKRKAEDSFSEAYMTHTSTSPNYQILASLDAGRRQVQFEGFEMVEKSIEMAMILRTKIQEHPSLRKYFDILTVKDIIPEQYRKSGIDHYFEADTGNSNMEKAWASDEFVLDPTKINLFIGKTGMDGDTFKNRYLMDQFGIQINKTSRNSVLFMTNIGTTRGSITYLIGALLKIAKQLDEEREAYNSEEMKIVHAQVISLTEDVPPLPHFSSFHTSFQAIPGVPGGDIRAAYFLAYHESNSTYIKLSDTLKALEDGQELVSSSFVIPYPPGFPILVPGQVVSKGILAFFIALDVSEIHGYRPELGLKIFTKEALSINGQKAANTNKGDSIKISKPVKTK
jgi:arginine decarboxylase